MPYEYEPAVKGKYIPNGIWTVTLENGHNVSSFFLSEDILKQALILLEKINEFSSNVVQLHANYFDAAGDSIFFNIGDFSFCWDCLTREVYVINHDHLVGHLFYKE